MPLRDVAVDTNVFAHADNPNEIRQADAVEFLSAFLESDALLLVDADFSLIEHENRSAIGSEYLQHIIAVALPLASATLARLASSSRILEISAAVPNHIRRRINQLVADPSDRVFVKVALNGESKVLCSHDFKHLSVRVRGELRSLSIAVLDANEACLRLSPPAGTT